MFMTNHVVDWEFWLFGELELQADVETDEVYAQMTLQPLSPVL